MHSTWAIIDRATGSGRKGASDVALELLRSLPWKRNVSFEWHGASYDKETLCHEVETINDW